MRAVAQSGQASEWSEPQKFVIVPEGAGGEAATVSNVSVEYVAGNVYMLRGQTQPGTNVYCAGKQTLAGSGGNFELQIAAPHAPRVTLDAAGTQAPRHLPIALHRDE